MTMYRVWGWALSEHLQLRLRGRTRGMARPERLIGRWRWRITFEAAYSLLKCLNDPNALKKDQKGDGP